MTLDEINKALEDYQGRLQYIAFKDHWIAKDGELYNEYQSKIHELKQAKARLEGEA